MARVEADRYQTLLEGLAVTRPPGSAGRQAGQDRRACPAARPERATWSDEPGTQDLPDGLDVVFPEAVAEVEANGCRAAFVVSTMAAVATVAEVRQGGATCRVTSGGMRRHPPSSDAWIGQDCPS